MFSPLDYGSTVTEVRVGQELNKEGTETCIFSLFFYC